MESQQQQQLGGSRRIAAADASPPAIENADSKQQEQPGWKKLLTFIGPGFLVSLAYLDPGNLETDLQAGANHRYELLWVILIGLIFALIIQSLAANLGVSTGKVNYIYEHQHSVLITFNGHVIRIKLYISSHVLHNLLWAYLNWQGKHLSELCKAEYPCFAKYCLWLLAELAVIAADIPEVIGTAFALNILFHIPIWCGVLLTGLSTLLLLGLQRFGIRKLELLISMLVFIMAACFFGEMSYVKPPASGVIKGMFVPKLTGQGATGDAIALIGALVMPHNLFLHSALVLSRKIPNTVRGINEACRYFLIESGIALFIAFLINVAVVSVSGTVCSSPNLSGENADHCSDLTLNSASFLLKNVLGRSSSTIYAIALLASGQSSAITGTYAGQFIMQGFLDLKMKKWIRNLLTRTIAITPSLIVSLIGGSSGAGRLIVIASMILSFELPFAMIPLLKFSSSSTKMGPHKNSMIIIIISWILGAGIIGINVYYLSTGFVGWLIHNSLPKVANAFIGIIVFPLMVIYIVAVIYLTLRKDTVKTYIETKDDPTVQNHMEKGLMDPNNAQVELGHAPCREDLADVPFPQ